VITKAMRLHSNAMAQYRQGLQQCAIDATNTRQARMGKTSKTILGKSLCGFALSADCRHT